jgi:nitroimidazol reductase NimA-like FMN-containing flavoprotein (pyridoxamine 5'-phosphate oxidase superfamily)
MPTPRTTVRRRAQRGEYDPETVHAILDEGFVCHVGVVDEEAGGPVVLPTGYVRIGDEVVLHGSIANRTLRVAAEGRPVCVTVTLLDGLVLARSAFAHSMNYRSVVAFGYVRVLEGPEKEQALTAFVDHIVPGRSAEARPPNERELAATLVVAVPLDEASAKVRSGPPTDVEADRGLDVWTGVIPISLVRHPPEPSP